MAEPWVVTLPEQDLVDAVTPPDGVRLRVWDLSSPLDDPDDVTVVVPPYMGVGDWGPVLAGLPALRLVQTLTAGYETLLPLVPDGVALANAVGVHDTSTGELAVGLAIAALRGLPDFVRAADDGRWAPQRRRALADRNVLVLGAGGVGRAVVERLLPFEAHVTVVARSARPSGPAGLPVHGIDALDHLLPEHDVVVLTVPLDDATRHLVDARFLAALPDGALVVNVARGGVVDTDALLAELRSGRLLAALDVTDPEPLPPGHPLWTAPGVLISPHVGGATSAFRPRAVAMLTDLLERLSTGRPPRGIVVPGRSEPFTGDR
ncbi:MAG TPA: 2-hydroxyacid dehydrogenase [Angustibacter sp.]|nr:2-hydroxyacid dehydrogenase [Angustibacter sp.]